MTVGAMYEGEVVPSITFSKGPQTGNRKYGWWQAIGEHQLKELILLLN